MLKNDFKIFEYEGVTISGQRYKLILVAFLLFYGASAVVVSLIMSLQEIFG